MSAYLEQEITKIFGDVNAYTGGHQFKCAIATLVGKCFRKNTVMALDKKEIEEAKPLIEYILNFARTTREKYKNNDAVSEYERKVE